LQDLKERLQKAEGEAEERQKLVEVLNAKLDDALGEQAKLEERAHEEEEKVESLENEKRELTRQHRELEGIYEAERAQVMKDKEETQTREEEMQGTIQRLKETMATKHMPTGEPEEEPQISRACKSWPPWQQRGDGVHSDTQQQASATTLPAPTRRRTSRAASPRLHRPTRSSAATRGTTRSSSTRRTRSSRICVSSWPNTRSRCSRWKMLEGVACAS
jgi:hypothetical protein